MSAANWGMGGGLNIFFRGRNVHVDWQSKSSFLACCLLENPQHKPRHAEKSRGIMFWGVNACGACIHTRVNTGFFFRGFLFETCIRTFARALYRYSGCIHTPPVPIHIIFFGGRGDVDSVRIQGKTSWQMIYVLLGRCFGFFFFSVPGAGKGRKRPSRLWGGWGITILFEMGGGLSEIEAGESTGAARMSASRKGGGLNVFFFSVPKCPPRLVSYQGVPFGEILGAFLLARPVFNTGPVLGLPGPATGVVWALRAQ